MPRGHSTTNNLPQELLDPGIDLVATLNLDPVPRRRGRLKPDDIRGERLHVSLHEARQAGQAGRRVDGEDGTLDLWVDGARGEGGRLVGLIEVVDEGAVPVFVCSIVSQW